VGLFVHIASSNQYISAPEYDNFDVFLDKKTPKIQTFLLSQNSREFPREFGKSQIPGNSRKGIPDGLWSHRCSLAVFSPLLSADRQIPTQCCWLLVSFIKHCDEFLWVSTAITLNDLEPQKEGFSECILLISYLQDMTSFSIDDLEQF